MLYADTFKIFYTKISLSFKEFLIPILKVMQPFNVYVLGLSLSIIRLILHFMNLSHLWWDTAIHFRSLKCDIYPKRNRVVPLNQALLFYVLLLNLFQFNYL
jgi:hypothetical protein